MRTVYLLIIIFCSLNKILAIQIDTHWNLSASTKFPQSHQIQIDKLPFILTYHAIPKIQVQLYKRGYLDIQELTSIKLFLKNNICNFPSKKTTNNSLSDYLNAPYNCGGYIFYNTQDIKILLGLSNKTHNPDQPIYWLNPGINQKINKIILSKVLEPLINFKSLENLTQFKTSLDLCFPIEKLDEDLKKFANHLLVKSIDAEGALTLFGIKPASQFICDESNSEVYNHIRIEEQTLLLEQALSLGEDIKFLIDNDPSRGSYNVFIFNKNNILNVIKQYPNFLKKILNLNEEDSYSIIIDKIKNYFNYINSCSDLPD